MTMDAFTRLKTAVRRVVGNPVIAVSNAVRPVAKNWRSQIIPPSLAR